ncbi:mitochondrial carrier domain-containing protein [Fimicolochytrium jonesii]|uniref:mitochondrial carrier domain-containing protein n=1 Tax=Fimicolochytrium jonesii TaxID=1396493 RepID=UPI0022FDC4FB|nr:mitochondrial carrier domain-containing protein [Fimicolochytrium jonesii]KAI8821349.1 mitochondrial carrier domain-containing protein [Fimicolochytrium jonesii]
MGTKEPLVATQKNAALKSFLAGGCGGFAMVGASHPFDLTKVLMQTSGENMHSKSTFQVMRTIFAENGIRGLYKGAVPVFGAAPPVLATCLWAYYMGQVLVRDFTGGPAHPNPSAELIDTLSLGQVGLAGAFSAVPTSLILGPAEQVKIRLQLAKAGASKGAFAVMGDIVNQSGVRGLFRGTGLTLMRDVPGSFFYFATYEAIKRGLTTGIDAQLNPATVLLSGGLAGMVNWTVAIPIDTVKSRFQSSAGSSGSLAQCFRQILAEGGPQALFRGLRPTLIRAFPASAAFFGGVEGSKLILNRIL